MAEYIISDQLPPPGGPYSHVMEIDVVAVRPT